MTDWEATLTKVRAQPGVVSAAPFVHRRTRSCSKGNDYAEPLKVVGHAAGDAGCAGGDADPAARDGAATSRSRHPTTRCAAS